MPWLIGYPRERLHGETLIEAAQEAGWMPS